MKPRGILPTHVSDTQVVLCKASPRIRNAYEIRLALFMAVQSGRTFALAVLPDAKVDEALEDHVVQHGGSVMRATIKDYSVYIGAIDQHGEEVDGWVAGDNEAWGSVLAALRSPWLRGRLCVGGGVANADLAQFRDAMSIETISTRNVDDEGIHHALLRLGAEAMHVGGSIFVQ